MANTFKTKLLTHGLYQLGDFNSGLAHEINNPLAILAGQLSIMKIMLDKGQLTEEKLTEKITKLENATQRIIDIVESIRKLPRSVNNKELMPVPLNDILEIISFLIAYPCKKANIAFTCPEIKDHAFVLCIWEEIVVVINGLLRTCVSAIEELDDNKFIKLEIQATPHHLHVNISCNRHPEVEKELLEIYKDILSQYNFDLLLERGCFKISMPITNEQSAA